MNKELETIIKECKYNTDTDFNGDNTFRIHVKTAEKLINKAYKVGKEQGFKEGQDNILESQDN